MNLIPKNQLKLYGLNDYIDNLISLYQKNLLPNKILLSGSKGIGKCTLSYHFINYVFSKNEDYSYDINNYTIINKKLKGKASEIEFSERLSVLEYGKFRIKTDPIDVNTFDSLGLMWWIDHDIMDMGGFNNLTRHVYDNEYKEDKIYSYKFSKVFYSDDKDGISELDFTIHDMDIMDITCQLSWPFDD